MKEEIWKDIEGYEGLYQVSNFGRVQSLDRYVKATNNGKRFLKGTILSGQKHKYGYLRLGLFKKGKIKNFSIHRLVAIAFIPNPENKSQVNHIDGNKENNCAENLEWVMASENIQHAYDMNLKEIRMGEKNIMSKLTNKQALKIREEYASGKFKQKELAKKYGVGVNVICRIVNNKTYKTE